MEKIKQTSKSILFVKEHPFECACGSIGVGLSGAWLFCLLLSDVSLSVGFGASSDLFYVMKALCLSAFCAAGVVSLLVSRYMNCIERLFMLWAVCAVCELTGLITNLQPLGILLSAFGGALLCALWAVYLLQRKMASVFISAGAMLAGIVLLLLPYCADDVRRFVLALLPIASMLLYSVTVVPMRASAAFAVASDTKWRGFFNAPHFVFTRVSDVLLGMAFCFVCVQNSFASICFLGGGTLLIVGLAVFVCSSWGLYIYKKATIATYLCLAIIPIMLLPFAEDGVRAACGALLIASISIYKLLNILKYANNIIMKPFSELRYFGTVCACVSAGMLVGLGLFALFANNNMFVRSIILLVLFVCCMAATFVLLGCFRGETMGDIDFADPNSFWRKQVGIVAKRFNLTARQVDVLHALSRGRNARFIEEKYCLSSGTVKTHIRTVYSKLEVHSQQELIDMVRDAKDETVAGESAAEF